MSLSNPLRLRAARAIIIHTGYNIIQGPKPHVPPWVRQLEIITLLAAVAATVQLYQEKFGKRQQYFRLPRSYRCPKYLE